MTRKIAPATRYNVTAWASWRDVAEGRPMIDSYHESESEALGAARACPWPLVDVIDRAKCRMIGDRCTLPHPASSPETLAGWLARDTLHEVTP